MTAYLRRASHSLLLVFVFGAFGCDCDSDAGALPDSSVGDLGVDADVDSGATDVDASTGDADVDSGATDVDADVDGTVVDLDADVDADVDGTVVDLDAGTDADVDATVPVDSGVDGGAPSCQGTPTACSTLGNLTCQLQDGCSTTGTFDSCSGTPNPCSSYTNQIACALAGAIGCSWSPGMGGSCTGTPTACSTRNQNTCLEGCVAVGACTGTATACAGFTTMNTCDLQDGCTWQ